MTENTKTHCCAEMENLLNAGEIHLAYLPKFREFGIDYRDGGSGIQTINFCPWCGCELKKSLRQEWFDEIDQLGLDENEPLPCPLTTDEWWKVKAL